MPAFHGILLTRDDEDIIDQCISHALKWCDYLYIYETGGFDRTWDIVNSWSNKDARISCFKNVDGQALMESGLRAYVFEKYRNNIKQGDWIVQVDSDEFYDISPREFTQLNIKSNESVIFNCTYEFRLLKSEVERWKETPRAIEERILPIKQRRKYYNILRHSEPRLFRYRDSMKWPPWNAYPYNVGYVAKRRIPVRHYPQRDPIQLKKRWALRNILASQADPNWKHWQSDSWINLLASDQDFDLYLWDTDSPLPEDISTHHLAPFPKRSLQFLLHLGVMNILDYIRPEFPCDYIPNQLSDEIVSRIRESFSAIDAEFIS